MARVNDYYQNMPKPRRPTPGGIGGGAGGVRMPERAGMGTTRKKAKRRGQMKALSAGSVGTGNVGNIGGFRPPSY